MVGRIGEERVVDDGEVRLSVGRGFTRSDYCLVCSSARRGAPNPAGSTIGASSPPRLAQSGPPLVHLRGHQARGALRLLRRRNGPNPPLFAMSGWPSGAMILQLKVVAFHLWQQSRQAWTPMRLIRLRILATRSEPAHDDPPQAM